VREGIGVEMMSYSPRALQEQVSCDYVQLRQGMVR
jgi:hypothetical protein